MRLTLISLVAVSIVSSVFAEPTSRPVEKNPRYQSWASHGPGTSVTMKCVNKTGTKSNEVETHTVLREVTPTYVVTESTMSAVEGATKRRLRTSSEKIESTQPVIVTGAKEVGKEEITIAGTLYQTTHETSSSSVDGKPFTSNFWFSLEMPGRIVKAELVNGEGATRMKSHFIVTRVELKK